MTGRIPPPHIPIIDPRGFANTEWYRYFSHTESGLGIIPDGDYGDISITAMTFTINAKAVGNAKLANMTAGTIKGRALGVGTGVPSDLTAAQAKAIIASAGEALTKVDDTNVTVTLGGTPTTALLAATSLTLGWTGTLAVARGGTGGGVASGTLLDNITGFGSTGIMTRTAAGTYAFRTATAGAGITVTNGDGVSGNPTFAITDTIVAGGPTGSNSAVPVLTWNSRGQLTAVSTAALGTAAVKNTGTSGNTVPLLDGANTWSAAQIVSGLVTATSFRGLGNDFTGASGAGLEAGYYSGGPYAFVQGYNRTSSAYTPLVLSGSQVTITIGATDSLTLTSSNITAATDISVPDEAYGAGWDGSLEVPTKNAVYDKIQALSGSGAMILIEEWTADGTTGTKTFSSISGSYTDLRIVIRGRGSTAATQVSIGATFNGDSGSNYDDIYVQGNNATTSTASELTQANANIAAIPAASFANEAGIVTLDIWHYANTSFHKKWTAHVGWRTADSAAGSVRRDIDGNWSSTAAITSVAITLASGNFVSGSKISLYGIS